MAGVVTAAHIHIAPVGVNGPVVFPLGVPTSPIVATWSGSGLAANLSDLFAGNLYVNIHSALYPGGEIRGQLLQQVPVRPTAVPTMTEWGMIILMMVLGIGSFYFLRRKRMAEKS